MNKQDTKWEEMYEYANIYYNHYKNLEVPARFKTNDGYTYDENGSINLGNWIYEQRRKYKKGNLIQDRIDMLEDIGMRFENKISTLTWEEMYDYAKKYYERHNNLEVPVRFVTNDGYTYDENGKISLGNWINTQKTTYKKGNLIQDRVDMLEDIGMRFKNKINLLTWEEMYEYANIYYNHYKNLEVPARFKTNDGYTYDENGSINLGNWINTQKTTYKKGNLIQDRIDMLEDIGMRFENKISTLTWEEMYDYAKKYYEHHNNLEVPDRFVTNDGYTYDENGEIKLGIWITTQRTRDKQGILTKGRIDLLEDIEMRFENKINLLTWEEMYKYAKTYYQHHGNLHINFQFKTSNGYEMDNCGQITLGFWINTQRQNYRKGKLTQGQVTLLENIGMIWSVKKNKEEILELCNNNNIDVSINKDILKHISIQELQSKINFLNSNNTPLTNDGKLHEIFNMSNSNMKEKYGITLEDIINEYYKNNKKGMGV